MSASLVKDITPMWFYISFYILFFSFSNFPSLKDFGSPCHFSFKSANFNHFLLSSYYSIFLLPSSPSENVSLDSFPAPSTSPPLLWCSYYLFCSSPSSGLLLESWAVWAMWGNKSLHASILLHCLYTIYTI